MVTRPHQRGLSCMSEVESPQLPAGVGNDADFPASNGDFAHALFSGKDQALTIRQGDRWRHHPGYHIREGHKPEILWSN